MKVLQVHNRYRFRGGEDAVFENTLRLLKAHGMEACSFERSSQDMAGGLPRKVQAVFSGIYSPAAARDMAACLAAERPDVVHVHNLFPLLSPSVLTACRKAGIPVVMTCHNFRLICPIGVHFRQGKVCEECRGGREHRCILNNCRDSRFESAAYGMRNLLTRKLGLFKNNVTRFIAISEFLKGRLTEAGYAEDRIDVVYNTIALPETGVDAAQGAYAAFTGRLSEEKGIETLLAAAAALPDVPVKIGGVGPIEDKLKAMAPANVEFVGMLDKPGLAGLYRNARCLIVPSVWFETFGLVAAEAMAHGVPVIASRMGALPELVRDGETGFLFEAGNAEDLSVKIRTLWNDAALATRMGGAGRARAGQEFDELTHFRRLAAVYEKAIATHRNGIA